MRSLPGSKLKKAKHGVSGTSNRSNSSRWLNNKRPAVVEAAPTCRPAQLRPKPADRLSYGKRTTQMCRVKWKKGAKGQKVNREWCKQRFLWIPSTGRERKGFVLQDDSPRLPPSYLLLSAVGCSFQWTPIVQGITQIRSHLRSQPVCSPLAGCSAPPHLPGAHKSHGKKPWERNAKKKLASVDIEQILRKWFWEQTEEAEKYGKRSHLAIDIRRQTVWITRLVCGTSSTSEKLWQTGSYRKCSACKGALQMSPCTVQIQV